MDFITWIIGIFIRVFSFDIYTTRFVNNPGSRWSPGHVRGHLCGPQCGAQFVGVTYFECMKFWRQLPRLWWQIFRSVTKILKSMLCLPTSKKVTNKLGCVVRIVVDSIHAESGPNDHRKDAPPFRLRLQHKRSIVTPSTWQKSCY